jgi:Outer membrane lipoprotein-sorting protein
VARRKTPTPPKPENAPGGRNGAGAKPAAAPADPPGTAKTDPPSASEDNAPAKSAAPPADAEPAPALVATALPNTTVAAATPPAAADGRADARTIMEDVQRRSEVKSYRYDGLLQAFDANEHTTEKRWTFERLGSHGQSKGVVRFTAPPEVKGVALLIHNHPDRASDQWMWTPALERDRRIAMQDRSTRFFGTDFSFEDLEERDVEQFDYTMLGSETIDGAECWKIQSLPKRSKSSQYTQSISWIRKDNSVAVRIDSYIKNEAVRRLTFSTIENIQGIWTARMLDMKDLRRTTHTRLTLQQVKYGAPMKNDDFTLQALKR